MSTEKYRDLAIQFFNNFSKGDAKAALELLDENAVWKAMGTKGDMPISGQMDKQGVGQLITSVKDSMPAGLAFTFSGWTIQGNRLAAEIESYGELANGKVYNNYYHFLLEFKNGRIALIKEYMDTLHVSEIFLPE